IPFIMRKKRETETTYNETPNPLQQRRRQRRLRALARLEVVRSSLVVLGCALGCLFPKKPTHLLPLRLLKRPISLRQYRLDGSFLCRLGGLLGLLAFGETHLRKRRMRLLLRRLALLPRVFLCAQALSLPITHLLIRLRPRALRRSLLLAPDDRRRRKGLLRLLPRLLNHVVPLLQAAASFGGGFGFGGGGFGFGLTQTKTHLLRRRLRLHDRLLLRLDLLLHRGGVLVLLRRFGRLIRLYFDGAHGADGGCFDWGNGVA
ncbi:hypothetical protein B0H13DRAFT_2159989, partial [Mycena leptocephala]